MSNKIILLSINDRKKLYSTTTEQYAIQPNIGMGLLDSYLESKRIKVDMYDETSNLSNEELIDIIEKEKPVLLGVICSGSNPSSSTMSMVGAIGFFNDLSKRDLDIKSFVQGGHPSVLPERTLKETGADFVIRGEGYKTIEQLYTALSNNGDYSNIPGLAYFNYSKYVDNGYSPLIDVEELGSVNWDKINPAKYKAHNWHTFGYKERSPYAVVWTSLGCPYGCSFCCTNNVFGKRSYRMRNMQEVLKEIDVLVIKHGVRHIKILDELFIIDHPRIEEFYNGLKARNYDLNMWCYARTDTVKPEILNKLRSVGMRWIAYGMESTSSRVLSDINKGSKRDFYDWVIKISKDAGMYLGIDIIAGLWLDDRESLEDTYQWCVGYNFEWLNMYPAFALPGTKMYEDYISDGRMEVPKSWEEYSLYGYNCYPLNSKYLSREEILRWRDSKFIEYYSRPEYISMINKVFGVDSVKEISRMVKNRLPRRILENAV